jgi:hypothetical protein
MPPPSVHYTDIHFPESRPQTRNTHKVDRKHDQPHRFFQIFLTTRSLGRTQLVRQPWKSSSWALRRHLTISPPCASHNSTLPLESLPRGEGRRHIPCVAHTCIAPLPIPGTFVSASPYTSVAPPIFWDFSVAPPIFWDFCLSHSWGLRLRAKYALTHSLTHSVCTLPLSRRGLQAS